MKKLGMVLAAIVVIALAVNYYAYTMVGVGFAVAIAGGLVFKGQGMPAWVLSRQKPIAFGLLGVGVVVLILGASSVSGMKAEHAAQAAKEAAEQEAAKRLDAQVEELARTRCTGALTDLAMLNGVTGYGNSISDPSVKASYESAQKRVWRCKDEIKASLKAGGQ